MRRALELARTAAAAGEVPVGSVLVRDDQLLAESHNRTIGQSDPTAHAEVVAIRAGAASQGDWRLLEKTRDVTLEPCAMCAGALVNSRVARLVYGAADPQAGFCGSLGDLTRDPRLNHRLEVSGGVLERECRDLLRSFFRALRNKQLIAKPKER